MQKNFEQDPATLLGLSIDDADVLAFLRKLDPNEAVRNNSLGEPRWVSESAGAEVHGGKTTRRITTVFCYVEGYEGNQGYSRGLPFGLTLGMTMDEVAACFPRPPDHSSEEHQAWDFDDYRVVASYDEDSGDMTAIGFTSQM